MAHLLFSSGPGKRPDRLRRNLLLLLFSIPLLLHAQTPIQIMGKIVEARTNAEVIGATVIVQEESLHPGAMTDVNSEFQLTVKELPVNLKIHYIGYREQEIAIYEEPTEPILITISENTILINEVVVIGYGTQKRSELTGAIASVPPERLTQVPVASIDNALQGSIAGVQVSQVSGQPGGQVSIRIRGGSSIQGGNEPLYVIDGFPFYNTTTSAGTLSGSSVNPLASINPGDIESIDILKDASATAIYGSRGANGVIIITTKKGKGETTNVSYDFSMGLQSLRKKIDVLNAHDFAILRNNALYDAYPDKGPYQYLSQSQIDQLGKGTDWQDEAFRTAWVQNHQLSITGGSKKTRYAISGNYFDQDGIIRNTGFRRLSTRINLDSQVYERLKVGFTLSAARTEANVAPSGIVSALLTMPPTATIYEADGSYTLQNPFENIFSNPIASLNEQKNKSTDYYVTGSIFGEYSILENLVLKVLAGTNINNNKEYNYIPNNIYEGASVNGEASLGTVAAYSWLNENTLNYTKEFNKKHFFNFLAGFTQQESRSEILRTGSSNFVNDYLTYNSLQSGSVTTTPYSDVETSALRSWLGRINYNLDHKYFLSVSFRGDGSSRFGQDRKWGYFPSAGAAWILSNEDFFQAARSVVTHLKIRASYGKTGNQEIGSYQSQATLSSINYLFGNSTVTGFKPDRIANPDLGWETTYQTDLGVDISFFKDRLSVGLDLYHKKRMIYYLTYRSPGHPDIVPLCKTTGPLKIKG
ncbi:MAG: SusC/RagA family TonB-linked outer membrane protein [Tannerellaceae bacterium]|nr:SusC/RagA family TonB-linked outer membrane protein [Tannerellaceae bacterium]